MNDFIEFAQRLLELGTKYKKLLFISHETDFMVRFNAECLDCGYTLDYC